MAKTRTFAIIIPAYKRFDLLMRLLTCLNEAPSPMPIFIQDDDPESDWERRIPQCAYERYGRNSTNLGFAANCNRAVEQMSCPPDVLIFMNQDLHGRVDWNTLLANFDDPDVAVVGCKLLFPAGGIQHAGIYFDGFCQPYHRYLGFMDDTYAPANTPMTVPAVTGAFFAVRYSIWKHFGGFDETAYPHGYFEDIDFCIRIQREGWKVFYDPRIQLTHDVGSSGGSSHFLRNAQTFKRRWVDSGLIVPDTRAVRESFWTLNRRSP